MKRFTSPQNLLGVLFLGVFAFNLLIMALDFPRFTIVAIILLVLFGGVLHPLAGRLLQLRPDEAGPQRSSARSTRSPTPASTS